MVDNEELTPEEQNTIIDKMVAGCIASKEEIQKFLTSGSYNHITATFYLLAESHLRRKRTGFSPAAHSHVLRKQSMPHAFASLALSPRGEYQKPIVIGQACIDSSILRSAVSPVDPLNRMRKISAAESGVLRPRSQVVQGSPVSRHKEKTSRGGLDLHVSSPLSASPVFRDESQDLVVDDKGKEETQQAHLSVCNGEAREHRLRKKTVTFAVDMNSSFSSETAMSTQQKLEEKGEQNDEKNKEERKESPRRGVVGPRGRRLIAARSSPSFSLKLPSEAVYSDDEDVNLLLSPDLKRRSPNWSNQHSPSPSHCFFQHSVSPPASPEQRNKWNRSPVFVRMSHEGSSQDFLKEKNDDVMTAASAEVV
jgi:hypothetical protein